MYVRVRSTLCASKAFPISLNFGGDTLRNGIERRELVCLPSALQHLLRSRIICSHECPSKSESARQKYLYIPDTTHTSERKDRNLVNRIKHLDIMTRSKDSNSHHPILIYPLSNIWFVQAQLVSRKCARLVRAQDVDTRKRFNGSQFLDDAFPSGEVGGSDGHSGRCYAGETDRDTDDLISDIH